LELNSLNKMGLKNILLEKDIKFKRKVIKENTGKEVLLHDRHNDWIHAILSDPVDEKNYFVLMNENPTDQKKLFYHDLQQLILLKENGDFLPLRIYTLAYELYTLKKK